jgi:hypothetical protein
MQKVLAWLESLPPEEVRNVAKVTTDGKIGHVNLAVPPEVMAGIIGRSS